MTQSEEVIVTSDSLKPCWSWHFAGNKEAKVFEMRHDCTCALRCCQGALTSTAVDKIVTEAREKSNKAFRIGTLCETRASRVLMVSSECSAEDFRDGANDLRCASRLVHKLVAASPQVRRLPHCGADDVVLKWGCAHVVLWLLSVGMADVVVDFVMGGVNGGQLLSCDDAALVALGVVSLPRRQELLMAKSLLLQANIGKIVGQVTGLTRQVRSLEDEVKKSKIDQSIERCM